MMKKRKWFGKMVATALVATIIANGCYAGHANAESRTMTVNKKTVYISSSITKTTAKGSTGSDGSVSSVKVKSVYISAKNGKLASPVTKTINGKNMATASFSAPSGAVSKSITSSHTASYNGAQGVDTTAASR